MAWGAIWGKYGSELVEWKEEIISEKYVSTFQKGFRQIFFNGKMLKDTFFMEDESPCHTA